MKAKVKDIPINTTVNNTRFIMHMKEFVGKTYEFTEHPERKDFYICDKLMNPGFVDLPYRFHISWLEIIPGGENIIPKDKNINVLEFI